jgi:hypothetical protein
VVVAALAVYGWELAAIVSARKRATLDWGVKTFLTAVTILAPLSLLATVLSWPRLPLNEFTGQLETLYGFLGLPGFVTFAIVVMLHKKFRSRLVSPTAHTSGACAVPPLAEIRAVPLVLVG